MVATKKDLMFAKGCIHNEYSKNKALTKLKEYSCLCPLLAKKKGWLFMVHQDKLNLRCPIKEDDNMTEIQLRKEYCREKDILSVEALDVFEGPEIDPEYIKWREDRKVPNA